MNYESLYVIFHMGGFQHFISRNKLNLEVLSNKRKSLIFNFFNHGDFHYYFFNTIFNKF